MALCPEGRWVGVVSVLWLSRWAILARFAHVLGLLLLSQHTECQRILLFATSVSVSLCWPRQCGWNGCLNYDARP